MKWVPNWLGAAYCKLWSALGSRVFDINEVSIVLDEQKPSLCIIMSRLVENGFATRVRRGYYQMYSPSYLAAMMGGAVTLGKLSKSCYNQLLQGFLSVLFDYFGKRLWSVVVFGSVARDEASSESDIDVMVVVKEWNKTIMERAKEVARLDLELSDIRRKMWSKYKMLTPIQVLPLDKEEASLPRPLYMDMVLDAVILFDRDGFMKDILKQLESRMSEIGSKRVILPNKSWYWIMKEGVRMGEVFKI